jgi:hypothetical protein
MCTTRWISFSIVCLILQGSWDLQEAYAKERSSQSPATLAEGLQQFVPMLSGQQTAYELKGVINATIDDKPQQVDVRLARHDSESFDLELNHTDYAITIRRRDTATAMALPRHGVVYIGEGEIDEYDHLSPTGIIDRSVTSRTTLSTYAALAFQADAEGLSSLVTTLLGVTYDASSGKGVTGSDVNFQFDPTGALVVSSKDFQATLRLSANPGPAAAIEDWQGMRLIELPREELELQLARGLRRLLEIQFPSRVLTQPLQKPRQVEHGELRWIEGHRVAILQGTPQQIGDAHGKLLHDEAMACVDSVLYAFGTVETVRRGRWFRHELDAAYARLSPHIPERHKVETRALARSLGLDEALLESLNVFPELFHCSGFAIFGSATVDGKLYHGRVLDYMTAVGLQDAATTFVVAAEDQIPFVNVGYAGFIGSVSGMNAKAISLGEMGGRGEGNWDGVPMATLMRRALEECETLDQVKSLWANSPRTCEYYYVFADGKTNQAVGVAALPESIEFILPGQSHEQLGEGIADTVVLSAGNRLETLRTRVMEKHGSFDQSSALWLMSRPVAMESNLHNVLFVPADQVLLVANADHTRPAAECHYVRLDLRQLLPQSR